VVSGSGTLSLGFARARKEEGGMVNEMMRDSLHEYENTPDKPRVEAFGKRWGIAIETRTPTSSSL